MKKKNTHTDSWSTTTSMPSPHVATGFPGKPEPLESLALSRLSPGPYARRTPVQWPQDPPPRNGPFRGVRATCDVLSAGERSADVALERLAAQFVSQELDVHPFGVIVSCGLRVFICVVSCFPRTGGTKSAHDMKTSGAMTDAGASLNLAKAITARA